MRTKRMFSIIFFMLSTIVGGHFLIAGTACECGDHDTGITTWNVDGKDCCGDEAGPIATNISYSQQNNGVYAVESVAPITGSQAQEDCCHPA